MGLTTLGTWHTLIAVVALICGAISLWHYHRIDSRAVSGKAYIVLTVLTCLTGFGIFQHGGFGKPHALGVLTLLLLALAWLAEQRRAFGERAFMVATVCYSTTFYFHFIPGVTETLTRLPAGDPIAAHQEAPIILGIVGALFLVFLLGLYFQFQTLINRRKSAVDLLTPSRG